MTDLLKENKIGIIIAIALIVVGSAYYFGAGLGRMGTTAAVSKDVVDVLRDVQLKTAVADGKVLKLFALTSGEALSRLRVAEGSAMPGENALVIGSEEATMMREEKLFRKTGDKLENLFGINTTIGGVLVKTDTVIDDMHFVSSAQYRSINGEEGRSYIVLDEEGAPELHMTLKENEKPPMPLPLAEGNSSDYKIYTIVGVTYYPVIFGSQEAKMMREDKEFVKVGDQLEIRGKKAIVVGVLEKTGTVLDMMHISPLEQD